MTAKTFYPLATKFSGVEHLELQDGGVAPATATTSTGWTVGGIPAAFFSRMDSATERSSGTFGTTIQPSNAPNNTLGDCFVAGPYTGQFAAGTWTLTLPVIAVSRGGAQSGRLRARLWRASASSGSGAAEITSGGWVGSTVVNLSTGAAQNSTVMISLPLVTLANEYLFVQLAWEITTAAILFTDYDVLLRVGSATTITTPDFVTGQTLSALFHGTSAFLANVLNLPPLSAAMPGTSAFLANVSEVVSPGGFLSVVSAEKVLVSHNYSTGFVTAWRHGPLDIRATPAAPAIPMTIGGLTVWLTAQVLSSLYQDSTLTTPVTANADPIGGWVDQSGNGNTPIQATAGNRLAYATGGINGYPSVSCAGSGCKLISTYASSLAQPYTVFIVMQPTASFNIRYAMAGPDTTNDAPTFYGSVNYLLNAGADLSAGVLDTTARIWAFIPNGASSKIYKGGGSPITGNAGVKAMYGICVGNYPTFTNGLIGYIGEILVFNTALTTGNINTLGNYLSSTWGLTWSTVP